MMKTSLKLSFSLVVALSSLLLPLTPQAQQTQPQPGSSQSVTLTMIVTDGANHSLDDVRQEDVQLIEDKQPVTVSLFAKDTRPVDYALVMDTSGSFKALLPSVVETAKGLINSNHAEDETFIESFVNSDKIETVQEFTTDKAKLGAALDWLYVKNGQSAVIDAIYLAVKHTAEYSAPDRRRAVVVFTDGEDRASFYGADQLAKILRLNDVQVFIVGITKLLDRQAGLFRPSQRDAAEQLLNRIAEESGGRVFFPRDAKELAEAVSQIAHDLRFQFLVGFERQTKPGEKGFRKVRVKIANAPGREKVDVITRPGYLLSVAGSAQKPD
jgi:Ca-activated chloride channel family protein